MLAYAPLPVVETVLEHGLPAYTPHTLTTAGQLHRALASIRAKKMSVSRGEYGEGEIAIATAVFGPDGAVVGAIELAVDDLVGGMRLARPALVVAARSLSHLLAADPAALPTGSGAAPLLWRADPTSAALSWCVSESGRMTAAPEGRKLLRLEVRNSETPIEHKPPWIRTTRAYWSAVHRTQGPGS